MKQINAVAPIRIPLCMAFIRSQYDKAVKTSQDKKLMKARRGKPCTTVILINKEAGIVPMRGKKRQLYPLPQGEFIILKNLQESIPMSHITMDKMIIRGTFPKAFKKIGRSRVWKVKEVQNWLDKQENLNLIKK